jgi:hypothetical protein
MTVMVLVTSWSGVKYQQRWKNRSSCPGEMNNDGARYRDEIFDIYVRPYAGAVDPEFILMDDNARPHHARV